MINPRQALDLLILGMFWLSQECGERRPRRAAMIFRALRAAELIDETGRRAISRDSSYLALVKQHCHILATNTKPTKAELTALAAERQEPFILIVMPARLNNGRILGNDGYFMLLTDRGQQTARQLVRSYARLINRKAFMFGWDNARKRLGQQMSAMGRNGTKYTGARDTGTAANSERTLPKAQTTPDNWEW